MTNRTVQFLGQGYSPAGSTPITLDATLNGNTVYSGTIPTLYTSDIGRLPSEQQVLFTCELPVEFSGTVPMSITINSSADSGVFFEQVLANYVPVPNTIYSPEQSAVILNPTSTRAQKLAIWESLAVPPLSSEDITVLSSGTAEEVNIVLSAHNIQLLVSGGADVFGSINSTQSDARSNVVIDSVPQTRPLDPLGTWGWEVESTGNTSGVITYDLTITAGIE